MEVLGLLVEPGDGRLQGPGDPIPKVPYTIPRSLDLILGATRRLWGCGVGGLASGFGLGG